jgi:ankyrin repeat protein
MHSQRVLLNIARYIGEDGGTPPHKYANYGLAEMVRVLVELGANVHAQAKDGGTPP